MRLPPPTGAMRLAAAMLWIVVLGALFAGWLMNANTGGMRAFKRDLSSLCLSLGRAGVRCPDHSATDDRASDRLGTTGDCPALGKGGRVCFGDVAAEKAAD
jgi:hypothetical protein